MPRGHSRRRSGGRRSRRRFLRLAAAGTAGLAGCSLRPGDGGNGTENETPTPTETETPTPTPTETEAPTETEPPASPEECEVASIEPEGIGPDEEFPLLHVASEPVDGERFAVRSGVTRQFTEDRPAQLEIRLTNVSGEAVEFESGPTPPYSNFWGSHVDADAGIVIVPVTERHVEVILPRGPTDDGCWRIESELEREDVATVTELEPCETLTRIYDVYADFEPEAEEEGEEGEEPPENCLLHGTYRFEPTTLPDGTRWELAVAIGSRAQ